MSEKVAIVTGGSRGIGRATCVRLAADGFRVVVNYNASAAAAEDVVAEIEAAGGVAVAIQADVSQSAEVDRLVRETLAQFGRIDVLFNNAGVATKSGTLDLDEATWDRIIDTNLKSAFLCSKAVIPAMRAVGGGRIINNSSVAGQHGGNIGPHYAASKAGMLGLTRFMARELGPDLITVNAVAPAGVVTEIFDDIGMKPGRGPLDRGGHVDDVAAAISYLASDGAGYVTGQTISINGGAFMA